jgi:hypothetical protein
MYYSFGPTLRSIQVGDYKLIEYLAEMGEHSTLLFNNSEDPMELPNLYF